MANLASSAVALQNEWTEASTMGHRHLFRTVVLTLTGQGDGTDKITAEALGLTTIHGCSVAMMDDGTPLIAASSYDGSYVLLFVQGATELLAAPTTGTVRITVNGF